MTLDASIKAANLTEVEAWLQDFPENVVSLCVTWLKDTPDGSWVVSPDKELAEFRLNSTASLAKVQHTLRHLWRNLPPPGRVIWRLENWNNRGLDDFEAEAVFGSWLDIELLSQTAPGSEKSKLIIGGRLRDERIGLSFLLEHANGYKIFQQLLSLRYLGWTNSPAVIFIDHEWANYLVKHPRHPLAMALQYALSKNVELGLWVPTYRLDIALDNMQAEIAPLELVTAGKSKINLIRLTSPEMTICPHRLTRAMKAAALNGDSSLIISKKEATEEKRQLSGPYFYAGAYQPQPFDIRTPAGIWNPDSWIELIGMSLEDMSLEQFWAWRLGYNMERLARLLDYKRMESYFRDSENSIELAQRYHEYRIYNWPRPDSTPRSTFIECGPLHNLGKVISIIHQTKRMEKESGSRWRIVGQLELLTTARNEAKQRSGTNSDTDILSILTGQIKAHTYMEALSLESQQLRKDTLKFIDFLPSTLGQTLELGSGYGQLAQVLSGNAKSYICLDLTPKMFKSLKQELSQHGVAADIHRLPFDNEIFDTVIADNVLEHSHQPLTLLKEVHRILCPGGHLYAAIPLDALNANYSRRAHLWKADEEGVRSALTMANLALTRHDVIDLYTLDETGAFPACNGLILNLEATKPSRY